MRSVQGTAPPEQGCGAYYVLLYKHTVPMGRYVCIKKVKQLAAHAEGVSGYGRHCNSISDLNLVANPDHCKLLPVHWPSCHLYPSDRFKTYSVSLIIFSGQTGF